MFFRRSAAETLPERLAECAPAIWRFALSLSGRPDVADDLTQATCLRALEKSHQLRAETQLLGWLMRICRSVWLNELRTPAIRRAGALSAAELEEIVDARPGPETQVFASEVYARIMALPEAQRATVELVYVEQFTYSEAAAILEVPIGTVMSRLATARAALKPLADTEPSMRRRSRP